MLRHNFYEFIRQMAVGLKERSGADAIGSSLGLINKVVGTSAEQLFFRMCLPVLHLTKDHDSGDFRHGGTQLLGPCSQGCTLRIWRRRNLDEQLRIFCVCEELDLEDSMRNVARPPILPKD